MTSVIDERLAKILMRVNQLVKGYYLSNRLPIWEAEEKGQLKGVRVLGDMARFHYRPILKPRYRNDPFFVVTQQGRVVNAVQQIEHARSSGMLAELKRQLNLKEQDEINVTVDSGCLCFDFPLEELVGRSDYFFPVPVARLPLSLEGRSSGFILLGEAMNGTFIRIPLDDAYAHLLIAGTTGSGKTILGRTMLYELLRRHTPDEVRVFLASGREDDVRPWRQHVAPHFLFPPVCEPGNIEETNNLVLSFLEWLEEERARREETNITEPNIVIILGEVGTLVEDAGEQFLRLIRRHTRAGRGAGIRIWSFTQKALTSQVGGSIVKANLRPAVILKTTSKTDSYVNIGEGGYEAHRLPGRGAAVTSQGTVFQVAITTESEVEILCASLVQKFGKPEFLSLAEADLETRGDGWLTEEVAQWLLNRVEIGLAKNDLMGHLHLGWAAVSAIWDELEQKGVVQGRVARNVKAPLSEEALKAFLEARE